MMNRRDLLKAGVGAVPLLAGNVALSESARIHGATAESLPKIAAAASLPWVRQIRRAGQLNMTEHDPVSLDVEAWADYWANLKAGITFISVTGILAYYQTKSSVSQEGEIPRHSGLFWRLPRSRAEARICVLWRA